MAEEGSFQDELTLLKFLILGLDKFQNVDIRVRVTGGGHSSQIYAIRTSPSTASSPYGGVPRHARRTAPGTVSHRGIC